MSHTLVLLLWLTNLYKYARITLIGLNVEERCYGAKK